MHRTKVPNTSEIRSEIKSQQYAQLSKHELRLILLYAAKISPGDGVRY